MDQKKHQPIQIIESDIIKQAVDGVLRANSWTPSGTSFGSLTRSGGLLLSGEAIQGDRCVRLMSAGFQRDAQNRTCVEINLKDGPTFFRISAPVAVVAVCHVIGQNPCMAPWATHENAARAEQACADAGASNGRLVYAAVLNGIGEPPSVEQA